MNHHPITTAARRITRDANATHHTITTYYDATTGEYVDSTPGNAGLVQRPENTIRFRGTKGDGRGFRWTYRGVQNALDEHAREEALSV